MPTDSTSAWNEQIQQRELRISQAQADLRQELSSTVQRINGAKLRPADLVIGVMTTNAQARRILGNDKEGDITLEAIVRVADLLGCTVHIELRRK